MAVATAFIAVAVLFGLANGELHFLPTPATIDPMSLVALIVGGGLAAALGVLDDYFDLRARWQFAFQLGLAAFAIALGVTIEFVSDPFGPEVIRLAEPFAIGFTVAVDRRDDQQHQLHRRPRRPVLRGRADRRRDARADQPDRRRPAVRRRALLCACWGAARVPALELPPCVDVRRDERRDVHRLHAGRAVDPGHREGRRRAARAGGPDHRRVLDHRPPRRPAPVAVLARTAAISTTGCSMSACPIARPCC